jgi:hypothetical protein
MHTGVSQMNGHARLSTGKTMVNFIQRMIRHRAKAQLNCTHNRYERKWRPMDTRRVSNGTRISWRGETR